MNPHDPVRIGLVSTSDRAASGVYADQGIPALQDWLGRALRNPIHWEPRLIPDEQARDNHAEIGIPLLASIILRHDPDGEIRGLDEFKGAHPPVAPVFFAFRAMVGTGVLMLAVSWAGWWICRRRGWRADALPRALLWTLAGMTFSGWVATLAGWYVTEVGRQPFIVYGLLRTAEVASTVPGSMIALTLTLYVTLYLALIVAYVSVLKYMAEKPDDAVIDEPALVPLPAGSLS